MAVWKKSARRGSCSSNGSNNDKPTSPAQASPAPRNISSPVTNNSMEHSSHKIEEGESCSDQMIRKRGRPRKHFSMVNHHYFINNQQQHAQKIQCHLAARGEQSQLSDYELLNMRRREEILSMFRELFSANIDSDKMNKTLEKRKYSKRPLPPMRPRSLRLLGLAPGQRPLRRRRHSVGPRCHCCWLTKSSNEFHFMHK